MPTRASGSSDPIVVAGLVQHVRQLRHVRRDPPRLVFGRQFGGRRPICLIFSPFHLAAGKPSIEIGKRCVASSTKPPIRRPDNNGCKPNEDN
jgi:hypothetical protein